MKKLAICLDGVIRNKLYQFDIYYRKKFIKNMGLVNMNDNFEFVDEGYSYDEEKRIEAITNEKIHLPISTYDLMNHYEFSSKKDFDKFLNEDYVLEIYGTAPQFPKSMDVANRIQYMGINDSIYETYLICTGENQAITSTLHFLTKNASRIKNISFREYNESLWNDFDIIITDAPTILDSKPAGKISIKVEQDYNTTSMCDMSCESLKDGYDNYMSLIKNKLQ